MRVPASSDDRLEIGPWLGVVADPPVPLGEELDAIRLELLDGLLRLGPRVGDGDGSAWFAVWQRAVDGVAERLGVRVEEALARASAVSRMPPDQIARHRPTDGDRERWRARLDSTGIPLERALAAPADHAESRIRQRGVATDEAWRALREVFTEERALWEARARMIHRWLPPTRPVWIAGGIAMGLLFLFGLAVGGYLPVPDAVRPVIDWWWSLPWP